MSNRNYPSHWTATFLSEAKIPEGAHLTAALITTFTPDGKIIAILQPRGLSIPGGHIDPGETPVQAAIRESFEEAMIVSVSEPTLVSVIQGDRGYMVAYIANLLEIAPFVAENTNNEVLERLEMFPEDYLNDPRAGKISREIVRRAVIIKNSLEKDFIFPIFEELAIAIGK